MRERENLIKKELDRRKRFFDVPTIPEYYDPNAIRFLDVSLIREPTDENCRTQNYVFDFSNEEFEVSFSSSFSE